MRAKTLVVDANVARSDRVGLNVLEAVNSGKHKVAFCEQLEKEWKNHASYFATRWLANMFSKRRVVRVKLHQTDADAIIQSLSDQTRRGIEDVHLVLVAMRTSKVVFSCDDRARKLFAKSTSRKVKTIHWTTPAWMRIRLRG